MEYAENLKYKATVHKQF